MSTQAAILTRMFACALTALGCMELRLARADPNSRSPTGIIQYNVKGGQGGWTAESQTRVKQVALIINEIKQLKGAAKPIDFITLEQADQPLLADDLVKAGMRGWTTIVSQCGQNTSKAPPDKIQLSYSDDWVLIKGPALQNPLANSYALDVCWMPGRPYNIAYFKNKRNHLEVIIVVVHLPHCRNRDFAACETGWHSAEFIENLRKVVPGYLTEARQPTLIVSGDLNELGEDGGLMDLAHLFGQSGPAFFKSTNVKTCCEDNGFVGAYDHIVTNGGSISETEIIEDGAYPFNPDFNKHHPNERVHNEEHKAMYSVVMLPML